MAKRNSQAVQRPTASGRTVVRGRFADGLLERISAHDRFQVEIKRNYLPERGRQTRYELFTYLFLPYTLGVSARTYSPSDFYRNLQNYVRLRTPRLTPEQIFESEQSPLVRLERLARDPEEKSRIDRIVANLKLLYPVAKIALAALASAEAPPEASQADASIGRAQQCLDLCETLLERFRALGDPLEALSSVEVSGAYRLVDEALGLFVEQILLERHEALEPLGDGKKLKKLRSRIRQAVASGQEHRDRQRAAAGAEPLKDDELLERLSLLKKYSSEVLYLRTERKPEGKTIEHAALAGAAGLAMAFATLVTFFSQRFWNTFSIELFVAFVCGYMFKDRIKEIARGWLASALNKRLADHRLIVWSRDGLRQLGYIRERARFVDAQETPPAVLRQRKSWTEQALLEAPAVRSEVVLVHRRQVVFDPAALDAPGERAASDGLSDIARLDIRPFLSKMDDPRAKRRRFKGDRVETVRYQRTYPVYLITATRANPNEEPSVVAAARIQLNRKGVRAIDSLALEGAPDGLTPKP